MDGIEVCRQLKTTPSLPFMPIIMVTAMADSKDMVAGLEAGSDEYLTKPLDQAALVARVKSMLRTKMLHDAVEEQAKQIAAQSVKLEELNSSLRQQVAEQLAELERIGARGSWRVTGVRSPWSSAIFGDSRLFQRPQSRKR